MRRKKAGERSFIPQRHARQGSCRFAFVLRKKEADAELPDRSASACSSFLPGSFALLIAECSAWAGEAAGRANATRHTAG